VSSLAPPERLLVAVGTLLMVLGMSDSCSKVNLGEVCDQMVQRGQKEQDTVTSVG
jgi:hypothetical protein